jgi:hypothetical protein
LWPSLRLLRVLNFCHPQRSARSSMVKLTVSVSRAGPWEILPGVRKRRTDA